MSQTIAASETMLGRAPLGRGRALVVRLALTAGVLVVWFWTQSMIGARGLDGGAIHDRLHTGLALGNSYLHAHLAMANALLIVSSGMVDMLGIFLLAQWIFGGSLRPFLALVIVLGLRQLMQWLVALPAPPDAIWHYPGVPSLLVTYGVSNDYFFSGHTAIAVLGAAELARLERRWLLLAGIAVVVFEVFVVLVLRAHYTMDVFTGAITALYAAHLADSLSCRIDRSRLRPNAGDS